MEKRVHMDSLFRYLKYRIILSMYLYRNSVAGYV